MNYCSTCGKQNLDEAAFCTHCGAKLTPPAKPSPTKSEITAKSPLMETDGKPSRSLGSRVGAFAGLILTIAFFLPWLSSCGQEFSGYDIATETRIDNSWIFWGVFLGGLILIGLFAMFQTRNGKERVSLAAWRAGASLLAAAPVVAVLYSYFEDGSIELLFGIWVAVAGTLLALLSFFIDVMGSNPGERVPIKGSFNSWLLASIISSVVAILFYPIIFGPLAIVLGIMAYNHNPQQGRLALVLAALATLVGMGLGYLAYVDFF